MAPNGVERRISPRCQGQGEQLQSKGMWNQAKPGTRCPGWLDSALTIELGAGRDNVAETLTLGIPAVPVSHCPQRSQRGGPTGTGSPRRRSQNTHWVRAPHETAPSSNQPRSGKRPGPRARASSSLPVRHIRLEQAPAGRGERAVAEEAGRGVGGPEAGPRWAGLASAG